MSNPNHPPEPYQPYPEDSARREHEEYASSQVVEQPSSIRTAVRLMQGGAALSVLGLLITLLTLSQLKDAVQKALANSDTSYTQADLDNAYHGLVAVAVISALIGIGLWLWMAWANGNGRKWARVVATILGVINVISYLYLVTAGTTTTLGLLVATLNVVIGVAALVFLYKSESTAYYNARSRR